MRRRGSSEGKKIDTGERDICAMCYQKQSAIEMAPPNGCALCERKEVLYVGTKIQIRAKEIFVLRAIKNVDVL